MVVVKTKFDEEKIKAIQELQFKRTKKLFLVLSIIITLLGLLYLAIAIDDMKLGEEYVGSLVVAIMLIVFGVGYYPFAKWLTKHSQTNANKSLMLISSETEETYKFDEDKLYIFTIKGEKYRSAIETTYDYVCNVVENDKYIYLFISKTQCHVISKSDITSGDIDELHTILKKHFDGTKYVRKYE